MRAENAPPNVLDALRTCRDQFAIYAQNHRTKERHAQTQYGRFSPPAAEAAAKAETNENLVRMLNSILGGAPAASETVRSPDGFDPRVFDKIVAWAADKHLVAPDRAPRQMLKLTEEVGEIAGAVARARQDEIIDGIGDAVVVLTILAAQHGVSLESCVMAAWHTIKDRTGKTVDGVFIKDEA